VNEQQTFAAAWLGLISDATRRPLQYPLVRLATIKLRADQPLRRKPPCSTKARGGCMAFDTPACSANT